MKKLFYIVIAVAVVGGVWWFLKPNSTPTSTGAAKSFTLVVQDRKLVSGPSELNVKQGDTVTIAITVNEDEELHLHGYDRSIDLKANVSGSLTFLADSSGRFPFELEDSKTEIGAVNVLP